MGSVYQDLGEYNEAKEYHEKALIIRIKAYEEHLPQETANCRNLKSDDDKHVRQRNQMNM